MGLHIEPVEALGQFLHYDLPRLASIERSIYDTQVGPVKGIVIYGCGKLGRVVAEGLTRAGHPPAAFVDANKNLSSTQKSDVPILSQSEAIAAFGQTHAFVVTVWRNYDKVKQALLDAKAKHVVHFLPLLWKFYSDLLPYYNLNLPSNMLHQIKEIEMAFSLFEDRASQEEFVFQLQWMTSLCCLHVPPCRPSDEQYFPIHNFDIGVEEVFIDCGAYIGDTIEAFRNRVGNAFRQIVAIEPDPTNLMKLKSFISALPNEARSKIRIEPYGLGSEERVMAFNATGSESSSVDDAGTVKIQINRLDVILGEIEPTYIKMDIEGAELEALIGAEETIRKYQPRIAACVYHAQEHLWKVPLEMNRLNPCYRLSLRRYRDEFGDVLCYAVPNKLV
jgi:FkbM family methyltransferase